MIKKYVLILFISLFILNFSEDDSENVHIFFTSNINGAWEDCGCFGVKMGGLARVKTVVDKYREKFNNVYLIDTGDSFTAFDYPEKNKAMLELMRELRYDFIPQADQELATASITSNYFDLEHSIFDFYLSSSSIEKNEEKLKKKINLKDNPFLIFHGDSSDFIKNKELFKSKKFIFLSHSHDTLKEKRGSFYLLQAGYDLEFLGHLIVDKDYNYIDSKLIRLDTTIAENPKILNKIEQFYKREPQILNQTTKKTHVFKGIDNCKQCHQEEFESWGKTNHANAFNTLKEVNRAFDKSCISCHTTGFNKGGFTSFEKSPQFVNVQCESCHTNIESDHQLAKNRIKRFKVDENSCLSCHTKENSPHFNYNKYLQKIKHWKND